MDTITELKQELKNAHLRSCYLFYGEEDYLKEFYREQLKKTVLYGEEDEFSYVQMSGEKFDLQYFMDVVTAYPMTSEKKFVVVTDLDIAKLSESDKKQLISMLKELPEFSIVLFFYGAQYTAADYRIKNKRVADFKKFGKEVYIVEFTRQNDRELVRWCIKHIRQAGLHMEQETAEFLVSYTDSNMASLRAELQKLVNYCEGEVKQEDIEAVVTKSLEADQFDLSNALAGGKFKEAILLLGVLKEKRAEPISVLSAISSTYMEMLAAKCAAAQGVSSAAVVKDFRMNPKREFLVKRYMANLRNIEVDTLAECVLLCSEADRSLKRSRADGWMILETMLAKMMVNMA